MSGPVIVPVAWLVFKAVCLWFAVGLAGAAVVSGFGRLERRVPWTAAFVVPVLLLGAIAAFVLALTGCAAAGGVPRVELRTVLTSHEAHMPMPGALGPLWPQNTQELRVENPTRDVVRVAVRCRDGSLHPFDVGPEDFEHELVAVNEEEFLRDPPACWIESWRTTGPGVAP